MRTALDVRHTWGNSAQPVSLDQVTLRDRLGLSTGLLGAFARAPGAKPDDPPLRANRSDRGGAEIVIGATAALVLARTGICNVAATAGHGPLATWFLHYTMQHSVEKHAASIQVPPLDDPVLALRGATHYHTDCAPCHGAPGNLRSVIEVRKPAQGSTDRFSAYPI